MGSFGKAGRTGNAEGKCDLAGILPEVCLGGGRSCRIGDAANAAESAESSLLAYMYT
jgi:hypothetical protein